MEKSQERARQIIRELLLTQGQLAREIEIDSGTFSRWLNNKARFEKSNMNKVWNWVKNR